jgi:hypothetical protein
MLRRSSGGNPTRLCDLFDAVDDVSTALVTWFNGGTVDGMMLLEESKP